MNEIVDLAFKVSASVAIPSDHRYHLFSTVSKLVPSVHGCSNFAIHPISGIQAADRRLELNTRSRLVIRAPTSLIGNFLSITGAELNINGISISCGNPEVRQLLPATMLRSSLVTIKRSDKKLDAASFIESVRKQLSGIGVAPNVEIVLPPRLSMSGQLRTARKTFEIKGRQIIGFEVRLAGLTADESLAVQVHGIGGRRSMGCGVFKPFTPLEVHPSLAAELEVSNA